MEGISFYSQFLHNPKSLQEGHKLIRNFLLQSEHNRWLTLNNLFHPNVPVLTLIGNVYANEVFIEVSKEEKHSTRCLLMNQLGSLVMSEGPQSKKLDNLLAFLQKIHTVEGYKEWMGMYGEIIQSLSGQNCGSFLLMILRRADSRIDILALQIFKFIIQNYPKLSLSIDSTMEILYLCCRSFAHLKGTDDESLNQYFHPSSQQVLKFAWSNLSHSPSVMKFSLKILIVLFTDMEMADEEVNLAYITQFPLFAMSICQEYLKQINSEGMREVMEEQEEEGSILGHIVYLLIQFLEVLMLSHQNIETQYIFYIALLSATPSLSEWQFWKSHSEEYLIASEDESQRTLRNRCAQMLVSLLEDHPNKNAHKNMFISYFTHLSRAVAENSTQILMQEIRKAIKFEYLLLGQVARYEEGTYFVLSSCISNLFTTEALTIQLKEYLAQRASLSSEMLIIIQTLLIYYSQVKPHQAINLCLFLNLIQEKFKQDNGMLLVICRGFGKCCLSTKLQIESQVSLNFIERVLCFLNKTKNGDVAHIGLQFLVKLIDCSEKNQFILKKLITPQIQMQMLLQFFHDGMLSAMVLEICQKLSHPQTITTIFQQVIMGNCTDDRISGLVVKWAKAGNLSIDANHIIILLQRYIGSKREIISNIVKYYLSLQAVDPCAIQSNLPLVELLNKDPEAVWLIFLLKCGILKDPTEYLVKNIRQITYEITSQYELESRMTLPFFMGINHPANFVQSMRKYENQLWNDFIKKFYRYAQLFKGDHLRIIASLFFIKISENESEIKQMAVSLIDAYGELEIDEWQEDNQSDEDENNLFDKLFGFKQINQELEKELSDIFGEIAWDSNHVKLEAQKLLQI